jgi:hypothetical protein
MFVCMELIQIHSSEPIWTKLCTHFPLDLEKVIGYVWIRNISTFQTFRRISLWVSADSCAVDGCWRHTPPLLGVTCTVGNALKTLRCERNACVWKWKPGETGRKCIMNCTSNCLAFIQMITHKVSNLRPSFFRSLSTGNTLFHLLKLPSRSSEIFR